VQDIEGATRERPREDKGTVAVDSALGGKVVWKFKNPISNIFAVEGPKEA
jgi:hypothetical protein